MRCAEPRRSSKTSRTGFVASVDEIVKHKEKSSCSRSDVLPRPSELVRACRTRPPTMRTPVGSGCRTSMPRPTRTQRASRTVTPNAEFDPRLPRGLRPARCGRAVADAREPVRRKARDPNGAAGAGPRQGSRTSGTGRSRASGRTGADAAATARDGGSDRPSARATATSRGGGSGPGRLPGAGEPAGQPWTGEIRRSARGPMSRLVQPWTREPTAQPWAGEPWAE